MRARDIGPHPTVWLWKACISTWSWGVAATKQDLVESGEIIQSSWIGEILLTCESDPYWQLLCGCFNLRSLLLWLNSLTFEYITGVLKSILTRQMAIQDVEINASSRYAHSAIYKILLKICVVFTWTKHVQHNFFSLLALHTIFHLVLLLSFPSLGPAILLLYYVYYMWCDKLYPRQRTI